MRHRPIDLAASTAPVAVLTAALGIALSVLLTGSTASAAPAPRAPGWVWPVDGPRVVLRPFIAPPTPYGVGHRGADLAAPAPGAEVRAMLSGVVHFAGIVVDRPVVTIRAGQLLATVEPVEPSVVVGQSVRAGDLIGTLAPGHCGDPCLHLGVRVAGAYVSPLLYLGGLQRAVLLPIELAGAGPGY